MSAPWPQELMPAVEDRDWYTPLEVAEMVGVKRGAVQAWIHTGFIAGEKVNGMLRVSKGPFLAWYATMPTGRYKRPFKKTRSRRVPVDGLSGSTVS